MKRAVSNAFTRSPRGFRSPYRSLAASLACMQVNTERTEHGYALELSPMSTFDAVGAWTLIDDPDLSHRPLTIVLDATVASDPDLDINEQSVATLAVRWGVSVVPIGGSALLASDAALRQLLTLANLKSISMLRVAAPLDTEAARELVESLRGRDPLDDPRVLAAVAVREDRHVLLEARTLEQTMQLVGENFRHYLAAVRNEPPASFAPVPADVLGLWLHDGGSVTVRPIETEVYSSFIDVGLCCSGPTSGPATSSLIYDRPSRTWHGER